MGWGNQWNELPNCFPPQQNGRVQSVLLPPGLAANRPVASQRYQGYSYLATDTAGGTLYFCDGSAWVQMAAGVSSAGAVTSVNGFTGVVVLAASDVGAQPVDATLTALAGLTVAANSIILGTGADAFSDLALGANTIPGRSSAGNVVAKSVTDAGFALLAAADAAAETALLSAMVGDSGAGGTKGLVPAPAAGDAAAGKFLKSDGSFAVPPGTGGSGTVTSVSVTANGPISGTVATSTTTPAITITAPTRNYLANGGFGLAQRMLTPGTLTAIAATDAYSADRWKTAWSGSTQFARVDTNGALESGISARYYGQYKQTGNNIKDIFYQVLEGVDTLPLAGQPLIFQIKMKASSAMTIRMAILQLNSSGTIDTIPNSIQGAFGITGVDPTWSTNVAVVGSVVSQSVTTSWANYSVTATAPSNAKNLIVAVWQNALGSTNDILDMTEAGLYCGTTVQPWVDRHPQTELALCQRYCYSVVSDAASPVTNIAFGASNANGEPSFWLHLPVPLRTYPSATDLQTLGWATYTDLEVINWGSGTVKTPTTLTISARSNFHLLQINVGVAAGFAAGNPMVLRFIAAQPRRFYIDVDL